MAIVKFTVEMKLPPHATREHAFYYVQDALREWRGSLRPPGVDGGGNPDPTQKGDPMCALDEETIFVRFHR